MERNMTAEEIIAELSRRGLSQTGLASDLGHRSVSGVNREIYGNYQSHPVRLHIAKALGMDVVDVFPECYPGGVCLPPRRGRKKTRGLYGMAKAS